MFFKISVLKNFTKFTDKHLFNKAVGLSFLTSLKKRLHHKYFTLKSAKFLRTAFFITHFHQCLLLYREWWRNI